MPNWISRIVNVAAALTCVTLVAAAAKVCSAEEPTKTATPVESTQPGKAASGLDPTQIYLIVHAEDAGLCSSVNRATIDAMEQGIVSSAGIIVTGPAFEEVAKYAREHPERDFGISLTLNAEFETLPWKPVLPAKEVPGLVNSDGYLWPDYKQTAANALPEEVERELTAQIERAKAVGIPFTHFDTHIGTLLTRLDFLDVYVKLGIKYDVPILFTRKPDVLTKFPPAKPLAGRGKEAVRSLDAHQLPMVDDIFIHYVGDSLEKKREYYLNLFRGLKPGAYQVNMHCGYPAADLLEFSSSAGLRDSDRQIVVDPETLREIDELGIQIMNWKQFRQMTASPK